MDEDPKDEIWIGVAHVFALPEADILQDCNGAYVNLMTWANSSATYQDKVRILTDDLRLQLTGIQNAEPISERETRGLLTPEIAELEEEVKEARHSIRYMTFHTYTKINT